MVKWWAEWDLSTMPRHQLSKVPKSKASTWWAKLLAHLWLDSKKRVLSITWRMVSAKRDCYPCYTQKLILGEQRHQLKKLQLTLLRYDTGDQDPIRQLPKSATHPPWEDTAHGGHAKLTNPLIVQLWTSHLGISKWKCHQIQQRRQYLARLMGIMNSTSFMPIGLCNAPTTFQRLVEAEFAGLIPGKCLFDNILVTGKTWEEHQQNTSSDSRRQDCNIISFAEWSSIWGMLRVLCWSEESGCSGILSFYGCFWG